MRVWSLLIFSLYILVTGGGLRAEIDLRIADDEIYKRPNAWSGYIS